MKLNIPLQDGTALMFEGTSDELISIAEKFLEKHSPVALSNGAVAQPDSAMRVGGNRRWTEQSVGKLWSLLYGDQAKLIKFLVERGGTATYQELEKHMGYGAQHLSGILSPITRNAQTATGDRLARLVDWRVADNGKREYYIDSAALSLLQHIMKQP